MRKVKHTVTHATGITVGRRTYKGAEQVAVMFNDDSIAWFGVHKFGILFEEI